MRMLLALLKDFLPSDSESQFLKFRQFLFTIINNKKTLVVKRLGGQAPLAHDGVCDGGCFYLHDV